MYTHFISKFCCSGTSSYITITSTFRSQRSPISLPRLNHPEHAHEDGEPAPDQTRIIHAGRIRGQRKGETVYDAPDEHVRARDRIDYEPDLVRHAEVASFLSTRSWGW